MKTSFLHKTARLGRATALALCFLGPLMVGAQTLQSVTVSKGVVNINEDFDLTVNLAQIGDQPIWCGLRVVYGDGRTQDIRVGNDPHRTLPLKLSHRYAGSGVFTVKVSGVYLSRGLKSAVPCSGADQSVAVRVKDPAVDEAARRLEDMAQREQLERQRLQQETERLAREKQELEARQRQVQERERLARERELQERERALQEREAAANRREAERKAAPAPAPAAAPAPAPAKPATSGF